MELAGLNLTLEPLQGQLEVLKTVQEVRATEELADAYVVEIDIKAASKVVKIIESELPKDPTMTTHHLRRFAKSEFLPAHLKREDPPAGATSNQKPAKPLTIHVLIPPPLPEISNLQTLLGPYAYSPEKAQSQAEETPETSQPRIEIRKTRIPLHPPSNLAQATQWSTKYWPMTYNPAAHPATHSPPPKIVGEVQRGIAPQAGKYLALAKKIADEARASGRGRGVGVAVVDPSVAEQDTNCNGTGLRGVVTVAGDARYWTSDTSRLGHASLSSSAPTSRRQSYGPDHEGKTDHHAVMRAIAMIAEKRLSGPETPSEGVPDVQALREPHATKSKSPPLTPLEFLFLHPAAPATSNIKNLSQIPSNDEQENERVGENPNANPLLTRSQGGYLCTGLDIYTTHEPCLSCAMGILLSRFRSIVFLRSGRMGGALTTFVPPAGQEPPSTSEGACSDAGETGTEDETEQRGKGDEGGGGRERMGYGLHWRRELNWRALGFEFVEDPVEANIPSGEHTIDSAPAQKRRRISHENDKTGKALFHA